jgi:hypothetical protein
MTGAQTRLRGTSILIILAEKTRWQENFLENFWVPGRGKPGLPNRAYLLIFIGRIRRFW